MNCLPVIEREMRSASRGRWTFGLRVAFAAAGMATCLVMLAIPQWAAAQRGHTMLVVLSFLTLAFCLVAGGFLTADCVSCEKREGTLGLLFLTPLTGADVVWGKMACHGLRLLFGVCAVFPVFFLPLLTGGVTWPEVSRILLALLLALLLAASVGLFVSVMGTESRKTMMATFASIVLVTAAPMAYLLVLQIVLPGPTLSLGVPQLSPVYTILSALESGYTRAGGPALFWGSAGALFALSMGLVAASGLLVGRMVQTVAKSGVRRRHCAAWSALSGVLERNPYEWTLLRGAGEAQSLGVLTHSFVGFFAAALIVSLTTPYWQAGFTAAFFTALAIHLITKLRFVVEVTRQISADRQSGALELLLVTALSEGGILEGHKRALRAVSRKPLMLLIGLNLVLEFCVLLCPHQLHIDSDARVMFTSLFGGGMVLAAADFFALRQIGFLEGPTGREPPKGRIAELRLNDASSLGRNGAAHSVDGKYSHRDHGLRGDVFGLGDRLRGLRQGAGPKRAQAA